MRFRVIVSFLVLSLSALAQEACEDIFVIEDPKQLTYLEIGCDDTTDILIAMPVSRPPETLNVLVSQKGNDTFVSFRGNRGRINGDLYNLNFERFGGNFEYKESFRFYGGVDRDTNFNTYYINHSNELRLYTLKLDKLTLEPTLHQEVRFTFKNYEQSMAQDILLQPASAGLYLRKKTTKKRDLIFGVGVGPAANLGSPSNRIWHNYYNFRLAIPL